MIVPFIPIIGSQEEEIKQKTYEKEIIMSTCCNGNGKRRESKDCCLNCEYHTLHGKSKSGDFVKEDNRVYCIRTPYRIIKIPQDWCGEYLKQMEEE